MKPRAKEVISRKHHLWKRVIEETHKCLKAGKGSETVSLVYLSNAKYMCLNQECLKYSFAYVWENLGGACFPYESCKILNSKTLWRPGSIGEESTIRFQKIVATKDLIHQEWLR